MLFRQALPLALCLSPAGFASAAPPLAATRNGTYQGVHLPTWDQDAFLGMPYAQPPVGDLRFRWPRSLNTSFAGQQVRNATGYGYSCMQYGHSYAPGLSEDCLTVNVIRPAGVVAPDASLPVLVWIYGGGLYWGSSADPQYNLSGVVRVGQDLGRPVVAVSFNYRLGMWGFLQTEQTFAEGSSNAGLLDQRLALMWIQENIASFGGDPAKVTIWGESAGAQSIAYHLFSYDGRDDGLFRAAILESGGPTGCQLEPLSWYNSAGENLTRAVGCWPAADHLACLRALAPAALYAATPSVVWNPLPDGDFLTAYPSQLMARGRFVKVPIITGANTDETFVVAAPGVARPDTQEDIWNSVFYYRSYALTPPTVRALLALYPDDPCYAPPYAITDCARNASLGRQWRRAAQIGSDMVMVAQRRRMAELYAGAGAGNANASDVGSGAGPRAYSYRFDQRLWNADPWQGVAHFENVAFSFQNISGLLGPSPQYASHRRLARGIGQAYVHFAHDLDPNGLVAAAEANVLPAWPAYSVGAPRNMVLNATRSWVEADTWRAEGIGFINTPEVTRELLG